MDYALSLGFPSADHFLASISMAQWKEWVEYAKLRGPVGPHRHDTLTAMLSVAIARPYMQGDLELDDFMPPWVPRPDNNDD